MGLLSAVMPWYEPHMKEKRLLAWRESGDRRDIICIDGNAKLHRRTCGAPMRRDRLFRLLRSVLGAGLA